MRRALAILLASLASIASNAAHIELPREGLIRIAAGDSLQEGAEITQANAIAVDIGNAPRLKGERIALFTSVAMTLPDGEELSDAVFISGAAVECNLSYDPSTGVVSAEVLETFPGESTKVTVWMAGDSDVDIPAQYWDHDGYGTWSDGAPGRRDTALFFGRAFVYGWEHKKDNHLSPFGTLALRGATLRFRSGYGWPHLSPMKIVGTGTLSLSGTGLQTVREHPCHVGRGVSVEAAYSSVVQDAWLMGNAAPLVIDGPVVMKNGFFIIYRGVTLNGDISIHSPYGPARIDRNGGCAINGTLTVSSAFTVAEGNSINGTVVMDGGTLTLAKGVEVPKITVAGGGSFELSHVNGDTIVKPVFWSGIRIFLLVTGFLAVIFLLMMLAFFFGVKMMRRTHQLMRAVRERELERVAFDAARRERLRLSMDLHDDFQQLLTGARFRLVAAKTFADEGRREESVSQLEEARVALDYAQTDLRAVLWTLNEESAGPGSLLDLFRHAVSRMTHWQGVVELISEGDEPKLARRLMGRLLMILQEAVGNAITHGDATKVLVKVVFGEKDLTMTVSDNGEGFNPDAIVCDNGHYGLRGMMTRAREGGGTLKIDSALGKGTVVTVTLPM